MNKFLKRLVLGLNHHGLLKFMSDKSCIELVYSAKTGKKLDLENPVTFNEKLQWLKLYDRNPAYKTMVDKFAVREYVKQKLGEEYLICNLGVWSNANDIDFDKLPDRFVLKCTHDCGSVVVCKDKSRLDRKQTVKYFNKKLKKSGYTYGREWPYKDIPRQITAEQYMEDKQTGELRDYKIHCFNGKPKFILVCSERLAEGGLKDDFFTTEWEHIDVRRPKHGNSDKVIQKPEQLEEMLRLAEILAKDLPFSRIDFYVVNGKIYFGEITFFPTSGYTAFVPDNYDEIFGGYIELPQKSNQK